jgi:hypothetical protein
MPKQIDQDLINGARSALAGLSGATAKQVALEYAGLAGVHLNRVYEWTKDVRPRRQTRADKGKRTADINHPMVRFAMEAVLIRGRLDPDLAIEQAELNFVNCQCGALVGPENTNCANCGACRLDGSSAEFPVCEGTFNRYLREHGLDRKQRRAPRVIKPYRRFEAKAPMEVYQFDITGLKKRWFWDTTTRRILNLSELEVSENHPNEDPRRQQIWAFQLVDDHARKRYAELVPCLKPNNTHVIKFLWAAFREMGIPQVLYTDNDPIIVCQKTRDAVAVLDRYCRLLGLGGCRMDQHAAGNSKATGKVEVAHKTLAKYFNLLGARHLYPSFDELNQLLAKACKRLNWRIHSSTGMMPEIRFRAGYEPQRMPPSEIFDSAFLADRLFVSITGSLTISVKNVEYQLPTGTTVLGPNAQSVQNPFLNRAGKRGELNKIGIIWPPDVDYFLAIVKDDKFGPGIVFEIPRAVAVPHEAGQYNVAAETVAEKTWKTLGVSAQNRRRAFRAEKRDLDRDRRQGFISEEDYRARVADIDLKVPLLNSPAVADATLAGTTLLPRKKIETNPELLAVAAGNILPPSVIEGQPIGYYEALGKFLDEDLISAGEFDKAWLLSQFGGDVNCSMNERDLRATLSVRTASGSDRVAREGVA